LVKLQAQNAILFLLKEVLQLECHLTYAHTRNLGFNIELTNSGHGNEELGVVTAGGGYILAVDIG